MSAGLVQGAFAQGNGGSTAQQPTQIVVTGSRIVRRDYTSNSPIVTLNAQAFQNTSNVAVEQTLDKLPQFNPAQNQFSESVDVQATPTNTVGASTISLRGLGPNRTLTLVDGRRMQPTNATLAVDINSIPSAMIDRVETISGGASAVYGADAIAGVVNFILKKNFQGAELDTQYGLTQLGDDREFTINGVIGTNFADDKGNVTLAVGHYTRSQALLTDRSFYKAGQSDPTVGPNFNTTEFTFPGSGFTTDALNDPSFQAIANVFCGGTLPCGVTDGLFSPTSSVNFLFNRPTSGSAVGSSTLWINGQGTAGTASYNPADNPGHNVYDYNAVNFNGFDLGSKQSPFPITTGNKKQAFDNQYLSLPLKRYSAYGQAHYDINDWLTAYMNANFTSTQVKTRLFSAPGINGWAVNIPYDCTYDSPIGCGTIDPNGAYNPSYLPYGNTTPTGASAVMTPGDPGHHPVSRQMAALLNSRPNPNAPWELYLVPASEGGFVPPRASIDSTNTWQVTAGFKGNLPIKDWTFDVYAQHGRTDAISKVTGEQSLQRIAALVTAPNYGLNWSSVNDPRVGNNGSPNYGFGIGQDSCTSGLPVVTRPTVTADCQQSIDAIVTSITQIEQSVVEYDMQGGLFYLPKATGGGQVRYAFGMDYREDSLTFSPDSLQSAGSFIDQVVGVYPSQATQGSTDTTEVYAELAVPVIKDKPFAKRIEFDPGARYSWNHPSDNTLTWKLLADWEVNDWLRFRGGYQEAVRTPNIGELYLPITQFFSAGAQFGDPCAPGAIASPINLSDGSTILAAPSATSVANTNTPFAAGNTSTPSPFGPGVSVAQNTSNICKALMKGFANQGAQPGWTVFTTPGTAAFFTQGPSAFGWLNQVGNPNLKPEITSTWTAGVVLGSPIQTPLLSRLQFSIDYYSILLRDAIGLQSPDFVYAQCLSQDGSTTAAAEAAASSPACSGVLRNVGTGGTNLPVTVPYTNGGRYSIEGFDAQLNWGADLADIYGLHSVPGSVSLNVNFNYLSKYNTIANTGLGPLVGLPADTFQIKWRGSLGPTTAGLNAGAFDYRINTTLTYAVGPVTVGMRWRYLPGVNQASVPANKTAAAVAAAVLGNPNASTVLTDLAKASAADKVGSHNDFDLFGNYTINDHLSLRAGINNLLDAAPEITGAHSLVPGAFFDFPTNSTGAGTTNPSFYDALGRRFYMGATVKF